VDLAGTWITVADSKTDAGVRKVKIRAALRDVLAALKPVDADPDAYVFATRTGGKQTASQVRNRILTVAVERANDSLTAAGEAPLPRLTPNGLRRTFASLLAIGETPPIVMQEMGHADSKLALDIYAHALRREPGENERMRALVDGESFGSFGSATEIEPANKSMERAA
jgi:integrase